MLKYNEIEKFYDSFGSKQDKQFYEESAINNLIEFAAFSEAKSVLEFGCGTGKLASRLLNHFLSSQCQYLALDISQKMITLCQQNIEQFSPRAKCYKNDGKPNLFISDQSADRFLSLYVLDLLTSKDRTNLIDEAHRILIPSGYLCIVSLTHGVSFFSKIVACCWHALFKLNPVLVGGCCPIEITKYLQPGKWHLIHHAVIVSYGVPSEVVIAKRI